VLLCRLYGTASLSEWPLANEPWKIRCPSSTSGFSKSARAYSASHPSLFGRIYCIRWKLQNVKLRLWNVVPLYSSDVQIVIPGLNTEMTSVRLEAIDQSRISQWVWFMFAKRESSVITQKAWWVMRIAVCSIHKFFSSL